MRRISSISTLLALAAGVALAEATSPISGRPMSLGGTTPPMSKRQARKAIKRANREAKERQQRGQS